MLDRRHTRSAYGRYKQIRRAVLRATGRWHRAGYDVRIGYAQARPAYKEIRFATRAEAVRVSDTLRVFADTPHVPAWHDRCTNVVRVEFVVGQTLEPVTDAALPGLADCLGCFGSRGARSVDLATSDLWVRHLERLDYLRQTDLVDASLHRRLLARSYERAPRELLVGYDYGDPIPANLVQRSDAGAAVCAIDVKNLRAGQPVGLGLAKMADRWLTPARRPCVFARLRALGLAGVEQNFEFLRLVEQIQRAARKTATDRRVARLFPKTRARRRALARLVE